MSAYQLLQRVRALGGEVRLQGTDLQITAPQPLPQELISELTRQKPAVVIALGAPFNHAIVSILEELRPNLPPALRSLSDSKLLVMVNWSILAAWQKTIDKLGHEYTTADPDVRGWTGPA